FKQVDPIFDNVPTFCIDHHYSHILSAWPMVPMDKVDVGVGIDGTGDNQLKMSIISNPGSLSSQVTYSTKNRTFGYLMTFIGNLMQLKGNTLDYPGKIMGLQAYGTVDYDYVKAINCKEIGETLADLVGKIPWRGMVPLDIPNFFKFENRSFCDWLATIHYVVECYVLELFKQYCHPAQHIVYSGGCAQNTVYNHKLQQIYPNLMIPPHCYDGGQSLGCLEFLRMYYSEPRFSAEGFPYWQADCEREEPDQAVIQRVVELLTEGKIVGWFQGRGEIGPRALGHRSILMDCRSADAKDILNNKVKHREIWRPFAPSILESKASQWFDMDQPSPYMLRAVYVHEKKKDLIPAVVHVDGTSRVQTVADQGVHCQDPFLTLLTEFHRQTGVPMLLNTSLNAGGSPIFAERAQCIDLFNTVAMDAMCMGNELLVK
ncbi:MAG TPA: carbamoyltransferase C-terminal domain-containing protein, partial [Bacillota bacterium]|nr:carbamoyltransferase C-terminal domain-containing protein [Bacillota bacterium]